MPPKHKAFSNCPVTRRKKLAHRLDSGVVIMCPCHPCAIVTPPKQCCVASDSGVCQNCTWSNNPNCDLVVTDHNWRKIDKAVIKLQKEVLETEERIATDMAKLL